MRALVDIQRYGVLICRRLWIRADFVPRDLWVGAYVKERYWVMGELHQVVYVCVIPMFPILLDWKIKRRELKPGDVLHGDFVKRDGTHSDTYTVGEKK